MARTIVALFPDRQSAEQAIVDLKDAGFDPARIGILLRDNREAREVAEDQGTRVSDVAVAGGIVGGAAAAALAATGALVIPGIGPFIAGGIMATVLGAGTGALIGGLVGLGVPEAEATYYQEQVSQGRALVTVDAAGREDEARAILRHNGAENLAEGGTAAGATARPAGDADGYAAPTAAADPGSGRDSRIAR